jgi:hypothetical protein
MFKKELRRTLRQGLDIAADLNRRQRFKAAYQELLNLEETLAQVDELRPEWEALLNAAQQGSSARIEQACDILDTILSQPIPDFDEEKALAALHTWADSLISDYDPAFTVYETRINNRLDAYVDHLEAQDVRREVETLWKNAKETSDKATAQDAIDKAYTLAFRAKGTYPQNPLVSDLFDQAEQLRTAEYRDELPLKLNPISQLVLDTSESLTPTLLVSSVGAYLQALEQLQHIICDVADIESIPIRIRHITQQSAISIHIEGCLEAIQIVQDLIVPWRQKYMGMERLPLTIQREKKRLALAILVEIVPDWAESNMSRYINQLFVPLEVLACGKLSI